MDENVRRRVVENAQKSSQHSEAYDAIWQGLANEAAYAEYAGYAKGRVDFIDYSVHRFIGAHSQRQILDLGCGNGWLTHYLARYGKATGIDFAPAAIQAAQDKYGAQASYLVANPDSPTLGLPEDAQFDLLVTSEVVEHVEDHAAFISQVAAFVKPDGWLILTTPNRAYWTHYLKDERFKLYGQPIENWLTVQACTQLLAKSGFQMLWHEGYADSGGYTLANKLADNRYLRKLMKVAGFYHPYARLIAPACLFQMFLARRV